MSLYINPANVVVPTSVKTQNEWIKCTQSFTRDFHIELTAYKIEKVAAIPHTKMDAFHGHVDAIQKRLKFINRVPILQLYKCIDRQSMKTLVDTSFLTEQPDDRANYIRTVSDLMLEDMISQQFSNDDTRYVIFKVDVLALLQDGWIPMYDRGYVYWYHETATGFRVRHVSERYVEY